MSDIQSGVEAAQQTRTPDFIPGYFEFQSVGDFEPETCEAVRILDEDAGDFPIAFLRDTETVRPATPPNRGVVVTFDDGDHRLMVPPGYWLIRVPRDGKLYISGNNYFHKRARRLNREWISPAKRARATAALQHGIEKAAQEVDEAAMAAGAEVLTDGINQVELADDQLDQLRYVDGDEGKRAVASAMRRRVVLDTLLSHGVTEPRARELTRAIETAFAVDARDEASAQAMLDEIDAVLSAGGCFGAGIVERVRRLLERVDTLEGQQQESQDAFNAAGRILDELDVPKNLGPLPPTVVNRLRELAASRDAQVDRLLKQREESREAEDHFRVQRDAALNTLRWIIGDLIPNGGDRQAEVMRRTEQMLQAMAVGDYDDEAAASPPSPEGEDPDYGDAPIWPIELERAFNHARNAIADFLSL